MLADAAAAKLFTLAPHLLMLADAAAATLFTVAPQEPVQGLWRQRLLRAPIAEKQLQRLRW